jgi:hypothetical protein
MKLFAEENALYIQPQVKLNPSPIIPRAGKGANGI